MDNDNPNNQLANHLDISALSELEAMNFNVSQPDASFKRPQNCHELVAYYHRAPKVEQQFLIQQLLHQMNSGAGFRPTEAHWRDQIAILGLLDPDVSSTWLQCVFDGWQGELLQSDWMRDVLIATLLRLQYYDPESLTAEGVTRIMDALLDKLADAEVLLGRIPDNAERTWEGVLMTISLLSQTLGAGIGEPLFRKLQKQVKLLSFNVEQLKSAYETLEKAEKKQSEQEAAMAKKQGLCLDNLPATTSQTVGTLAEDPIVKARARYRRMRQLAQVLEANYDCLAILRTRSQKVEQVGATVKRFVNAIESAVTGAVMLTAGTVVLGGALAALPVTYGAAAVVLIPALAAFFGTVVASGYAFIQAAQESGQGLLNLYYLGRNADEHPINGLLAGNFSDALTLPESITQHYLVLDMQTGRYILNKKVRGTASSHLLQFLQGLLINTGAAGALSIQHHEKVAQWMGSLLRALYAAHSRRPSSHIKGKLTGEDTLYDSICTQTLLLSQLLIRRFDWPLLAMTIDNPAQATLANWTFAYQQSGWLEHQRKETGKKAGTISDTHTRQLVHYITLCQPAFEVPPLHIPVVLSWWDHWYKDKHVESAWALYQAYKSGDTALGCLFLSAYKKMVKTVVTAQSRMTNDNYAPLLSSGALASAQVLKAVCAHEVERLRTTTTVGQIDCDALAHAMLQRNLLQGTHHSTDFTAETGETSFIAALFPWLLVSSYRSDLMLQTDMGEKPLSLDDYDTHLTAWFTTESRSVSQQKIEALNLGKALPQYLRMLLAKEDTDAMTLAQLSGQAQGHWRSLSLDNLFVPIMDMGIDLRKDGTQGAHAGIERQIVYGKPGVGNSTLCRFLATKWAEQKYWQMKQTQIMGAVTDNDGIGGYRWVFSVDVKALCALPDMATHTGRTTHALATAVYGLCLLPADRQRAEEGLYGHRKTASASPQQLSPQALRNGIIDWIEDEIIVPEEMQQDTLWIIDGLDRAQAYLHQPTVLGRLFKRLLHSTHVLIVTAPLARLPAMPALQRTLVNRGFLDKDIARYVYRYFAATPKVADDLWAVLVRNKGSHIWALCRTPLLLTLVCRLWEQAEDAAHRKHLATQWDSGVTAFYSAIVQAFFEAQYHREQMTASNGAITPFLADDHHSLEAGLQGLGHTAQARRQLLFTHYGPILSALGQFAFEGIRHQCGTLSLPLLEEVATAHRVKDMPTWLAQLRASGLFQAQRSVESLRQSIDGLSPHGFTHKALQPYLAAGYIAHVLNNHTQPMIRKQMEDFIIAHRYDAHWRGVWPLVAGITCETIVYMRAREVFWACLHAVPEDITGFGYLRLVTECLEATYIGGEQADAVLSGWRKSWVQLVKDWVPTSLSDVGSSHWEALVPILTPLTHLRRALLTALLVSMEEQAGTDVERQCHYLNQLMTGIVLLQETLLPDQKERLFAYLKSDAAPVRCAVAKGIASLVHQWQTDWKSLSTPLLAALQHETVDSVREALGQVLIAMGAMITGDAIVPIQTQICEAMTSKDSNVRKTVIRVLTQWMDVDKSASCLVPLWAMYHEASDVWIQCDLLKVLSLLGNTPNEREATAAQMIGIATQGQGHQYMRRAALVALSDMVGALDNGGARWINSLLQVINTDTQASLRKKAVDLMKAWVSRYPQESYEETAMALQRAMCKEADKGVQFALTELITVLKTLTMVCDDTPIVDAPIRHRLSRSKESPETPVNIYDLAWDMIGKVGKEESKTRLQGLKILFQHSKNRPERLEATIEALVERQLKEEDPWVRCDLLKTACTLALASTKARLRILPILKCSVLEDASPYVRRAGLRYLVEVARYEQGHEGEAAIIGGIGEIVLSAFTCVSLKSEGLRIKLVETLQVLAIGGLIKEVDAVAVLLAAVKGETSLLLRQHLVMALGTLGGAIEQANEVLVYLLQSLNTENNSLLRDTLLLSLQEIVEKRGGLGVVTTELEPAIVVNKTVTRTDMALLGLALQSPLLATGTVCLNQDNTRAITKTQKDQQLSLWLAAVVKAQHPLLVTDEGLVVHLEQGGVLLPYKKGLTALKKRCISALTTHEVAIQEIQRWHRSLLSTGYGGSSGSPLCQSSLKRNTLTTFGGTVFKRVKSKSKENVLQITTPPALNSMASVECPML